MTTRVAPKAPIARLRTKSQLTLPEPVVRELGISAGDRFRVTVEDGGIRLQPLRKSYYGTLKGLWPDDWMEELRRDRDSWAP
jgi:bifunctional DNA-binding transcriptional regulator/antitoxin component of YhaV-PrlF toxin-antitoxin module